MTAEQWQRVAELYDAALAQEPAARSAFLAQACAGDEQLQAEVLSLLRAHEQADGFLFTSTAETQAEEASASASVPSAATATAPRRSLTVWATWAVALLLCGFFLFTTVLAFRYGATDKFGYRTRVAQDGQFISEVHAQGPAFGKLQVGDRVLALNGDVRFSRVTVFARLPRLPDDQIYSLRVERQQAGQATELEFQLPCTSYPYPVVARWPRLLTHLLRGLICLAVAVLLLWLKPAERFARIACWAFLAISVLEMRVILEPLQRQLSGWAYFAVLSFWGVTGGHLFVPFAYQTAYQFPPEVFRPKRFWTGLQWLLFAGLAVGFSRSSLSHLFGELPQNLTWLAQNAAHLAALKNFANWYYPVGLLAISAVLLRNYRAAEAVRQRRRIRWVIAGTLIATMSLTAIELLRLVAAAAGQAQLAGSGPFILLDAGANLLALAFPFSWVYAVLNRQIYDVRVVIRRGLQYLLAQRALSGLLVLPILGLLYQLVTKRHLTVDEAILSSEVFLGLAALAALATFFRGRLRDWLDRRFFRAAQRQEQLLLELLDELRAGDSLLPMVERLRERLAITLCPQNSFFFFREATTRNFRFLDLPGALALAERIWAVRIATQAEIWQQLEKEPHASAPDALALPTAGQRLLAQGRIELLVPCQTPNGEVVGAMLLGARGSEEPYSPTDRRLLLALARQLALVWEVAALREQVQRETRIRRDVLHRLEPAAFQLLHECEACGLCADATVSTCPQCGATLSLTLPIERTVARRYQLERLLGKGGMGQVYRARDLQLGRTVALKVLAAAQFGEALALRRFDREARATARLNHPNIVAVYDHGTTSAGGAWLALEYVEGVTLRAELSRGGVPPLAHSVAWFRQILAGVKAAHHAGVIHRDLKPENILLSGQARQQLKLLDFGLARLRQMELETNDKATSLTAAGMLIGTVGYMSPEQCNGAEADEQSDIFSLGILLAELLTGARPFDRPTYRATQAAILHEPFRLPTSPVEIDRTRLEQLLQRCLAKERGARFRSIEEFEAAAQSLFAI